eukprot:scaffold177_cov334-Pavlova_lutheri.AAC.13
MHEEGATAVSLARTTSTDVRRTRRASGERMRHAHFLEHDSLGMRGSGEGLLPLASQMALFVVFVGPQLLPAVGAQLASSSHSTCFPAFRFRSSALLALRRHRFAASPVLLRIHAVVHETLVGSPRPFDRDLHFWSSPRSVSSAPGPPGDALPSLPSACDAPHGGESCACGRRVGGGVSAPPSALPNRTLPPLANIRKGSPLGLSRCGPMG